MLFSPTAPSVRPSSVRARPLNYLSQAVGGGSSSGGSCPVRARSMISFMPLTACFKFGHAGPYDMRSLSMRGEHGEHVE